jgi:hypothetical protein
VQCPSEKGMLQVRRGEGRESGVYRFGMERWDISSVTAWLHLKECI